MQSLKNQKGVVLLMALMVLSTLTILTSSYIGVNVVRSKNISHTMARAQALSLAEAGLQQVFYNLLNDSDYRTTPTTVAASLGAGTYSTAVVKDGDDYTLTSTGTVDGISKVITRTGTTGTAASSFTSAVKTGGNDISFKDTNGTVTGNIESKKEVKDTDDMIHTGTITENSTTSPPALSLSAYEAIADTVVNGDKIFTAGVYTGIWYIDGDVEIEANVIIVGTVVSTKQIEIKENEDNIAITAGAGGAALVADKDIKIIKADHLAITGMVYAKKNIQIEESDHLTITGLVYAKKNIQIEESDNTTITGALAAGKEMIIERNNALTITYGAITLGPLTSVVGGGAGLIIQSDWAEA
ncbi:MAG: Tfp pilus assembly protein PilX [Candidatus Omnitrophota bacterium]|jgi:Tfp pilus assembly protein PilX